MLECTIRVANSSNVGTTGLTGTNIKFRRSPFGSGDEITIAGVSGGTNGIYLCSFIGVPYQAAQLWIDGVYQTTWGTKYIGDISEEYLSKDNASSQTMAGAIAMGSNKITGLAAGTANGDAVRYEQVVRLTDSQSITGLKGFVLFPYKSYEAVSELIPSALSEFTTKHYVDTVLGGAISMVQSDYLIRLMPSRTSDDYSKTTGELCNSYLAGLTDISTRTGVVLVEPLGQATNTIDVDNSTTAWISDGVFYQGIGSKPILNRKALQDSITISKGGVINCRIKDGATSVPVVGLRTYVGWTFQDCEFDIPDITDVTFSGCKFLGVNKLKSISGNAITITNCTGDMFWYNDTVSASVVISGSSQPADVRSVTAANFNW